MTNKAFAMAVSAFGVLDAAILSRLPSRVRDRAFSLALKAKGRLFPGARRSDLRASEPERLLPRMAWDGAQTLPEWLVGEIEDLRRDVDPQIFRHGMPRAGFRQRAWPHHPAPMRALRAMQEACPSPRFVMIAPWVKRGGADLVVLKHLEEFARAGTTCLITTEAGRSEWISRVHGGVEVIEVGSLLAGLPHPVDRRLVLARFLMESGAQTIHLVNSRLGWETFRDHGRALAQRSRLFASLYCDDIVRPDGSFSGYAHEFLPACSPCLSGILSDNRRYLERLSKLYGIREESAHVAYVWTESAVETPPPGGRRVLWAGRLDRQKRPDILLAVAEACPDMTFDVYGGTMLSHDRSVLSRLRALSNVRMLGAYDGFSSIDTSDYSALLYTTAWDGLPNVLLEAGMRGMCVVATAVDGIPELITERTGWPVPPAAGGDQYARALRMALSSAEESIARGGALRRLVSERHSREAFAAGLKGIQGYL